MPDEQLASFYDRFWLEGAPPHDLEPHLRTLFETHVRPDADCLDVGCGDGRKSGLWLSEHARSYVGVDISAAAVAEAGRLGLDARQIDEASALPFEDESFDVVVCVEVLEHLFAPQLAVAEMKRVLRPGGTAIVTVPKVAYWRKRLELALLGRWDPHGDALAVAKPWRDPHIRFFNRGALVRLLSESGLDLVTIGGHQGAFVCDVPPMGRHFRRRSSAVYRALERRWPTLLGIGLHGVAVKRDVPAA